jgi:hypothetical protein
MTNHSTRFIQNGLVCAIIDIDITLPATRDIAFRASRALHQHSASFSSVFHDHRGLLAASPSGLMRQWKIQHNVAALVGSSGLQRMCSLDVAWMRNLSATVAASQVYCLSCLLRIRLPCKYPTLACPHLTDSITYWSRHLHISTSPHLHIPTFLQLRVADHDTLILYVL